jgi:ADP-heptose:LPS heptosyltransferase/predicted SAM-dependent methyltransferase
MIWRASDPEGNEAAKVKYDIVQYTRGTGLDVGCGPAKAFPHFIGVDNKKDTELFGIDMAPDNVVEDASTLPMVPDGRLDFVFSSHLLEHIEDYEAALAEWWRIIKVGGHLVLYLPHKDLYPNIGQPGSNRDHKHDFTPDDILASMAGICYEDANFDVIVNEVRDAGREYSFLLVIQKTDHPVTDWTCDQPKPEKTVCLTRFGGYGDMLQAANLLPELKRQGFHITINTTPKGQAILEHDPHIDAWLIVDDNQVPNHELPLFWESQAKRFTKFIQLSESVEGTLLALPGRANHMWPDAVRRVELNKNYLEWLAQLAEITYQPEAFFYPSAEEQARAIRYITDVRRARNPNLYIGEVGKPVFTVMWALSGSSMHKFYPWMDSVIAKVLLDMPEAVLILAGDEPCQILECGWELEPRVYRESGKLSIRDTLTLAAEVDCVIGPETGVLNSVAFRTNAKVLLLSHSSRENLSRDWTNTATLEPIDTACYPCHRLHYGATYCHQHEDTGAALCQVNITPDRVVEAIQDAYQRWKG